MSCIAIKLLREMACDSLQVDIFVKIYSHKLKKYVQKKSFTGWPLEIPLMPPAAGVFWRLFFWGVF